MTHDDHRQYHPRIAEKALQALRPCCVHRPSLPNRPPKADSAWQTYDGHRPSPQIYRTVYHRHRSRGMSVTEASQENRRVNDRHGCRGVSVAQTAQIHRTIDDGHGSSGVPIGQTAQIYRTIDNRHSRCGMPIAHTAMISRNRYYIVGCFCHTVGHTSYKRSGRFGRGTYGPGGASTAIDPTLSRPLHSVGQTERSQIHVFIGIPTCRSGRFSSRKNIKGKFGCLFHLLRIKQGIIQDYFFE